MDDFGTFAATPEIAGKFYQWNRNVAWDATGTVTDWNIDDIEGDSWAEDNDPSPEGWRVPTISLLDAEKVSNEWTTQNGVNGQLFTDIASGNTLFLPAAGRSGSSNGTLSATGTGYYWTTYSNTTTTAICLYLSSPTATPATVDRRTGCFVRSVAE
ncbi:hypothetical protein FACS189430_11450 [Bacteroidia bacterium]|nr:hypothetical protein FACS189430_11450 [Bacteroidia bacterium]